MTLLTHKYMNIQDKYINSRQVYQYSKQFYQYSKQSCQYSKQVYRYSKSISCTSIFLTSISIFIRSIFVRFGARYAGFLQEEIWGGGAADNKPLFFKTVAIVSTVFENFRMQQRPPLAETQNVWFVCI